MFEINFSYAMYHANSRFSRYTSCNAKNIAQLEITRLRRVPAMNLILYKRKNRWIRRIHSTSDTITIQYDKEYLITLPTYIGVDSYRRKIKPDLVSGAYHLAALYFEKRCRNVEVVNVRLARRGGYENRTTRLIHL